MAVRNLIAVSHRILLLVLFSATALRAETPPSGVVQADPMQKAAPDGDEKRFLAELSETAAKLKKAQRLPVDLHIADENGKPVEGAAVEVYWLHSGEEMNILASFVETLAAKAVKDFVSEMSGKTNGQGDVRLRVPKYYDWEGPRLTDRVSGRIKHPDYPEVNLSIVPEEFAKKTIKLSRNRVVSLRPVDEKTGQILKGANALIAPGGSRTLHVIEQPDGTLQSENLDPKQRYVRVFHPLQEPTLFSDEIDLDKTTATLLQPLQVQLRPGIRIEGRLDDKVPRPVRNGRVEVCTFEKTEWFVSAPIAADGSFTIPSFPRGKHFQIIAAGDGFVSQPFGREQLAHYARLHKWGPLHYETDYFVRPQYFPLEGELLKPVLKTNPAAEVRITVLGPDGSPVQNCQVVCHLNTAYQGMAHTIFLGHRNTYEGVNPDQDVWAKAGSRLYHGNPFAGQTKADGVVVFRNLPNSTQPLHFYVLHENLQLERTSFYRMDREPEKWKEVCVLLPAFSGKLTEAVILVSSKTALVGAQSGFMRIELPVVVRDENSTPVPGIEIMPLAVKMKETGAYHWLTSGQFGPQEKVKTGREGKALVSLPAAGANGGTISEVFLWHVGMGYQPYRYNRVPVAEGVQTIIRVSRPVDWSVYLPAGE